MRLYLEIGAMFAAISNYEKESVIDWRRSVKYWSIVAGGSKLDIVKRT